MDSVNSRVGLSMLTEKRKDWIIRVRVIRMWEALNLRRNNELLSVDMILLDEEGTTIQGTIHSNKVDQFRPIIKEGCLYEIECFQVKQSLKTYRTTDHKYSVHFLFATKIRDISENDKLIPKFWFRFAICERLAAESNKNIHLLDVIGQLTSISEITTTREKGTLQRDIKLQLMRTMSFFAKRKIMDIIEDNGWSYVSCSACMKKLAKVGSSYHCEKCNITNAIGILRYRIEVTDEDETDNATFTLFDRDVSSLIDISAAQLKEVKITPFNFTSSRKKFTVSKIIPINASDSLESKETMDTANGSERDAQLENTFVFMRKKRKLSRRSSIED